MKKTMKWAMAAVLSLGLAACPADDSKTEDKGDAVAKKTDEGAAKGDTEQPEKAPASKPSSAAASAPAADAAQAPKQSVYFVWPEEGSKVFEAFHVSFGLSGKSIEMAGKDIDDKNKGHHHLIIDGGPIKAGDIVPVDDKHIHFGKGQTKTDVMLPPGKHTLTMQFADGAHRSFGPEMSKTINIEVVSVQEGREISSST
jgi:hypothetical protein